MRMWLTIGPMLSLAAMAAAFPANGQSAIVPAAPPVAETLTVDRTDDSEERGTLRWAILRANARPGAYRIAITSPPTGPATTIRITRDLPPIKGPLAIEGTAWARDGRYAVIDGSAYLPRDLRSCPGAVPGQYGANVRTSSHPGLAIIDTQRVAIRGLEVRGFCIGILVQRASGIVIEDNRIVDNIGGAGVMFTGDDGAGGSTSDRTLDNKALRNAFVGNGDGLELTRGAAYTLVADNVFEAGPANLEPSQGIEILRGNDNVVVRNRFTGYSDGLQINWGARNHIAANRFDGNAFGMSVTGAGNTIDGNEFTGNGIGIALRPEGDPSAATRLIGNHVTDSGRPILRCFTGGSCDPKLVRGAIVLGVPGPEHQEYVGRRGMGVTLDPATAPTICGSVKAKSDCQAPAQGGLAPPRLGEARRIAGGTRVAGTAHGPANVAISVELFAARRAGEAGMSIGTIVASTGADGHATFAGEIAPVTPGFGYVTATMTTSAGATSALSDAVRVR